MPIRTSKSKIYRKMQVVNNIHRQIQFLTTHSMLKNNLTMTYRCQSKISYITNLRHCLGRDTVPTCTTCPGQDAVLLHALVGTQLFDMPWSRCSFTTCRDRMRFYYMHWSGRSYSACPGRDAVLRYALVRTRKVAFQQS